MKGKWLALVFALLAGTALATPWNASFEADPDGATDLAADIDLFFQQLKDEIRERAEVEHIWGPGGSADDNGLHHLGSARCFAQNGEPTDIALAQYNSTAGIDAGTSLQTTEVSGTVDLGVGRCWIDLDGPDGAAGTLDDNKLMVWDATANAFTAARSEASNALGNNLIYNGSFEVTDGTGSTASITVPSGWSLIGTPDIAYDDPVPVSEGEGVAMETIATGATNEGVSQSLASLKINTDYIVRARVRPVVGTCDLQVTGGDATVTDTSAAASGVFETLEVTTNTTAVPGALVVRLESNAAADECDWDAVVAFEKNANHPGAGIQVMQDDSAGAADTTCNNCGGYIAVTGLNDLIVTPPAPGYIVRLTAEATLTGDAAGAIAPGCGYRLRDVTNATTLRFGQSTSVNGGDDLSASVSWVSVNPTPGTSITYRFEITDSDGAGGQQCTVVTAIGGAYIRAELIPAR